MKTTILVIQIMLAGLLAFLILIQPKGKGLGKSFGGTSTSSFTRRGLEKWMFKLTFVIAFFFILASVFELIY
jgi:protein translocase SecG subunit